MDSAQSSQQIQLDQMKTYMTSLNPLFESLVSDLLFEQPSDPQSWMLEKITKLPQSSIDELRIENIGPAFDFRSPEQPATKPVLGGTDVVTSFRAVSAAALADLLVLLGELATLAYSRRGCVSFDVAKLNQSAASTSVTNFSNWSSRSDYDDFAQSAEFASFQTRARPLLVAEADRQIYSRVSAPSAAPGSPLTRSGSVRLSLPGRQ